MIKGIKDLIYKRGAILLRMASLSLIRKVGMILFLVAFFVLPSIYSFAIRLTQGNIVSMITKKGNHSCTMYEFLDLLKTIVNIQLSKEI